MSSQHESPAATDGLPRIDSDAVDAAAFRQVMGRFATGVTVMTALGADGEPGGMTANAVASVSLDPLLVLVCVARTADMAERVRSGGRFALSMLAADSQDLSNRFADRTRSLGWDVFHEVGFTTAATGAPILDNSIGWLDCVVEDLHAGGDHIIVVGRVVAADVPSEADALGYFKSRYVTISAS